MLTVTFYFDVVCPFAYLASTQIEAIAREAGAELVLRPVLLGGIYQALRPGDGKAQTSGEARTRHQDADLQRFARYWGVELRRPEGHPRRTLDAMRLLTAAARGGDAATLSRLMHALYRAYWVDGRDVADRAVLDGIAREHGLSPSAIDEPATKEALRAATDEALSRGVFGVPSFYVEGGDKPKLYFGQDRLRLVEETLGIPEPKRRAPDERRLPQAPESGRVVDFFFDISSPYSYLAATQIDEVAARAGGRARWRPFLLGGLFKSLGTPIPPLVAYSEPQRQHQGRDLLRWARHLGVRFQWPAAFPINTIAPLRMLVALEDADRAKLAKALFTAYWGEGRDVSDRAVLAEVVGAAGFDVEALARRTEEPQVKAGLVENGAAVVAAGGFGAPTYVVRDAQDALHFGPLYFGQDRLFFVAQALAGR